MLKSEKFSLRRLDLVALVCLVAVTGCAKAHKNSQAAETNTEDGRVFVGMSVTSADALPPCEASLAGRIVYVVTETGFRICNNDALQNSPENSASGQSGQPGQSGQSWQWRVAAVGSEDSWQSAFKLYQKFHNGVVRIAIQCKDANGLRMTSLGSGFHCAPGVICTAHHVLKCPKDSELGGINLHRIIGSGDSIAGLDNADMPPPFYSLDLNNASAAVLNQITHHPSRDLAKLKLTSDDPKVSAMPVLPWATAPFSETIKTLANVLSMSFPLGFTDLYTHLGSVNASSIGECNNSTNGCLRGKFDFSTTNDTDHGSSGSPLLDLQGRVVGVVTAGTEGNNANFTWAIDAWLLSAF